MSRFHQVGNKRDHYLVAVSGGPDSIFLLTKMVLLGYKVVVAHVNYKKRVESDWEQQLVSDYCKDLNVPFYTTTCSSYPKGNFQNISRVIRYQFFFNLVKEHQLSGIVIAHNFSDHLETYIIQKERNAFVSYWGLSFKSFQNQIEIIRPILSFRREQIIKFLTSREISYALDHSNYSFIYKRNLIRFRLNSFSDQQLFLLEQQITEDNQKLLIEKNHLLVAYHLVVRNQKLQLNNSWKTFSNNLRHRIIYKWINHFFNYKFSQTKKAIICEVNKQLSSKKANITFKLSNHCLLIKNGVSVYLERITDE